MCVCVRERERDCVCACERASAAGLGVVRFRAFGLGFGVCTPYGWSTRVRSTVFFATRSVSGRSNQKAIRNHLEPELGPFLRLVLEIDSTASTPQVPNTQPYTTLQYPNTPHPTPQTLHREPYTPNPAPYTLHPTPSLEGAGFGV